MVSKLFIKVISIGAVILVTYLLYISTVINIKSMPLSEMLNSNYITILDDKNVETENKTNNKVPNNEDLKYILLWTPANTVPFMYMGKGTSGFTERNCTYTNCYVTDDRQYLGAYTNFDVIAFAGPQLQYRDLPTVRSANQKYAFTSIESADYYPVCNDVFDNFFNWTWTFRLDSESRWGYIVIRNAKGEIVGPHKEMHWMKSEDMEPIDKSVEEILNKKTKAAAWFVSNCFSKSRREVIAKNLKTELKKYNLTLDIYGKCGNLKCPRSIGDNCNKMLEKDYYFYLSFENSMDEDYVTEKLLHSLKNYVVPIVYGGANYTRFMPEGNYLDANKMEIKDLALTMHRLIQNPDEYEKLFRWRKYYSYHFKRDSVDTDDYCSICALLNDERQLNSYSNYENFKMWWNTLMKC